MMKRILIILLLASISFAGACEANFATDFVGQMGGYIALAAAFMIVLISITFMLSKITNNPNLTVFYKDELFHLFVSAIIFASIGGIFYSSCVISTSFFDNLADQIPGGSACYTGVQSPQQVAKCYTEKMDSLASQSFKFSIRDSIRQNMDSTYMFGLYNPLTGGIITPIGAYKRTYALELDLLGNTFIIPALVSIATQRMALNFSIDLVKFLIPIALLFRFMPFTRPMGNFLIALSIGLYVVLPLMYAVNGVVASYVFSDCDDFSEITYDVVAGGCSSPYGFWTLARIISYAYFLPNLTLAIFITFLSAMNKAFQVIT